MQFQGLDNIRNLGKRMSDYLIQLGDDRNAEPNIKAVAVVTKFNVYFFVQL